MTIRDTYTYIKEKLEENPSICANEEAQLICCAVFNLDNSSFILNANENVSDANISEIDKIIQRRLNGEPIQYIIGSWPFMDLNFKVGPGVLIPRDDTEVLVNAALKIIENNQINTCVDLCSGSGIIAIIINNRFKNVKTIAVEKSENAFPYLVENAKENNCDITLVNESIEDYINKVDDASIDLLISNPPYVKSEEIKSLQEEISFEPSMALDGGDDGLYFYSFIINEYTKKISPNGYIALEIGEGQFDDIKQLLEHNGYKNIEYINDIQNIRRAVIAKR